MDKGIKRGWNASTRASEPIILLRSPKPGKPLDCILCGNGVVNADLHFDRQAGQYGRDVVCVGLPACGYCCANACPHPKHYFAAVLLSNREPFVLQLSDGGSTDLRRALVKFADWRGLILKVTRADRRKEARMKVEVKGRWDGEPFADDWDVVPTLERTWGMTGYSGTLRPFRPARLEPGELPEASGL